MSDVRVRTFNALGRAAYGTTQNLVLSALCRSAVAVTVGGWLLIGALPGHAQDTLSSNSGNPTTETSDEGFFSRWLNMVSRTQAEQPHWVTPLVATTPLLTQSFHYDILSERLPDGSHLNSYGGNKGLEFIPTPNIEVILAVPPWEQLTDSQSSSGFGDWPSILAKYRFLSANEQQGDYAVTAFLQFTGSNGSQGFSTGTDILEPGLAFGKGWGRFDVQMNLAVEFPLSGNQAAQDNGKPVLATVLAQYQVLDYVWPEFGFNFTWWPDGLRQGRTQLFLTPGVIFGPFPLYDRLKLAFGGGYQFAVTPAPVFNSNLIFSLRLYY